MAIKIKLHPVSGNELWLLPQNQAWLRGMEMDLTQRINTELNRAVLPSVLRVEVLSDED